MIDKTKLGIAPRDETNDRVIVKNTTRYIDLALKNQWALNLSIAKSLLKEKIRLKSHYFYFLGNCCWHTSNNDWNRNLPKNRKLGVKDVKTYSFVCVLNNVDKFFHKKESERHFRALLRALNEEAKGGRGSFEDYFIKYNKFNGINLFLATE